MAAGRHHLVPMPSSRSRLGSGSSSHFADRDGARDREFGYREREHERDYARDGYHHKERDRERERERERDRERYRDRDRERERGRERDRDAERGERSERAGKSGRSAAPRYEEAEAGRRVSPLQRPGSGGAASVPESPSSDETSGISGGGTHGGHGYRRASGRHSAKDDAEREPGELSSGSRSEEAGEGAVAGQPSRSSRHRRAAGGKADSGSPPPPKKRKYSPIVWDLDEKLTASDAALGESSSRVSPSRPPQALSGASPSPCPVSSLTPPPAIASPLLSTPPKLQTSPSNAVADGSPASASGAKSTPPTTKTASTPPSSSERKPPAGCRSISLSPPTHHAAGTIPNTSVMLSPPSPDRSIFSTYVAENSAERAWNDLQLLHSADSTPLSEDEPEPGQLPDSPVFDDPEEPIPSINIASSRWAEANASPSEAAEKSPGGKFGKQHSLSVESDELQLSTDQVVGQPGSLHMSPESGEYIKEKSERVGNGGSAGKEHELEHGRDGGLDQQYDRELNERELMELDVEAIHDDGEEQQPEPESDEEEAATVPPVPPQRTIDMLQGCRSVDEFERLNKIDEGTYGVVYRARNKNSGEIVALKKVKMEKERDGFPMTSLREINVLLSFHHPSIVDVKEVVVGSNLDSIYMVMEYMEHDLKSLMETMKQPFSQSEVKCLMLQLLEGIKYLHDNWVLHRDLKTSNLLLNNRGELKICDFGLARQYGSPLKSYTHMVVTLWYRAPELLLGTKQYSTAVDMWSAGCIMAEFLAKEPLFNGKSELDQLDKMFKTLGTPNEKIWPDFVNLPRVKCNFVRQPFNKLREKFPPTAFAGRPTLSESGFDLLNRLLTYDPKKRITAEESLIHEWFREVPLPKMKELMPTFPARSEHDRRMRRLMKSPDPLEEQRKRELRQGELGAGGLFG